MEINNSLTDNNPNKDFFCEKAVKESKKSLFKKPLEIVKILLKERALKQSELAEKIGLSRQALNNYLRGEWETPTQIKIKISQALGIDSSVVWDLERKK